MRLMDKNDFLDLFYVASAGQDKRFVEAVEMVVSDTPTIDAVPVVRCKDCKHRNKKKCPLVMVRLDVKTNGTIKEVLEQNYVDEDFWCKDGKRKDGEG